MAQFGSIPIWVVVAENPNAHPQVMYGVRKILRVVKADMATIDLLPDFYQEYVNQGTYVQVFMFERDPDENPLPELAMRTEQ